MIKKLILLFAISTLVITINAQQRIELAQTGLFPSSYSSTNTQVFINGNARLLSVIKDHKEINKGKLEIRGWRIIVYMGSGKNARNQANSVKLKIRNRYSDVEPHLVHHSPYFKILVGDYRTRIDAESFRRKLIREYPNSYVVESEVLKANL